MSSFDEVVTKEFSDTLETLFSTEISPIYRRAILQLGSVADYRGPLTTEFHHVLDRVLAHEEFLIAARRIVSGGTLYGSEGLAQQGRCGYCGRKLDEKLQCFKCGIRWESREGDPIKWNPIKRGER